MRLGPGKAEQRAGLRFAGLERDAAPAETTTETHKFPIVRALVEEQGLARGHTAHVDLIRLQVIREPLAAHIERAGVDLRARRAAACP